MSKFIKYKEDDTDTWLVLITDNKRKIFIQHKSWITALRYYFTALFLRKARQIFK